MVIVCHRMKKCSGCNQEKKLSAFPLSSYRRKDGSQNYAAWCRACYVNSAARYQKEHPEKAREWGSKKHRRRKYGLTQQQYEAMIQNQKSLCAICQEPETHITRGGHQGQLAVDHCHVTGKIRGLLCFRCNVALGKFRDNPIYLQNAMVYLLNGGFVSEDGQ